MMIDRYHNVHIIAVVDDSDYLDRDIHYKTWELVQKSTLLIFMLWFGVSLFYNNDAFELIKGYNQIIKHKQ